MVKVCKAREPRRLSGQRGSLSPQRSIATRAALVALSCALLLATAPVRASPPPSRALAEPAPEASASIEGTIEDSRTDEPFANAVVVLQCTCLDGLQERWTSERGVYSFKDLPPGNYTIQALAGRANVSKIVSLPAGGRFRANFKVDPGTWLADDAARRGGWAAVAVGGVFVLGGLSTGVALGVQDFEIPALGQHSEDLAMALGLGLGSAGLVMIAAGLGLIAERSRRALDDRRFSLAPSWTTEGGGLVLGGRF